MAEKKKRPTFTTPKGSALFAHISKPDFGTDKFPIKDGQYSTILVLSAEATEALKQRLSAEIEAAQEFAQEKFDGLKRITREKLGKLTWTDVCQKEYDKNDEETGNYLWRFKTAFKMEDKATGRTIERTVPCFDSMGTPVKLKDEVGNGSVIKVSFSTNPYFVEGQGMGGLSLYLNAVQILKLNKWGERDAASYGFDTEEDGYTFDGDTEDGEEAAGTPDSMEDSHGVTPSEVNNDDSIPF